jgi:hypothetical protein
MPPLSNTLKKLIKLLLKQLWILPMPRLNQLKQLLNLLPTLKQKPTQPTKPQVMMLKLLLPGLKPKQLPQLP